MAKHMIQIGGPMKDVFARAFMGKGGPGEREQAERAVKAIIPPKPPEKPNDAMPRISQALPCLFQAISAKDYEKCKGFIRQAIAVLQGKGVHHGDGSDAGAEAPAPVQPGG